MNPDDEEVVAVRSRKSADLIVEAQSSKHQFLHFPKNPFCRTCQRARMLAPYARSKGGQARVDTTRFGDHIIADHLLTRANVEEGIKGEKVALVIKDIHTQFRYAYPSQSRFAEDCTFAINHFVNGKDDVEVIYTDNSRELKAAIKELGYRRQTSIEYVDSSKSFVEREIRQMLEGARSNLVQAGMPLCMWPMAMQHFAIAVNANPQLSGGDSPWSLRFGAEFDGMRIPFGAKVLFWNNPDRADNTAGKLSPTSNEGVFLGYHIQPGFVWRGEYLVTKLEAIDYHLEHGSVVIQRTKRLELPSETHVFPLKAKADSLEPPPEPIADRVIPPVPDPIIPQQSDFIESRLDAPVTW